MAVVLRKYGLSIMLVPKGASTTIKHLAFEIENGRPFEPYMANSQKRYIHQLYHSGLFKHGEKMVNWKRDVFAVVRDPVERILSCHSNRVLHLGELDKVSLTDEDRDAGMTERPNFELFITHLDRYSQLSDKIKHHSLPMVRFLGDKAERYTRIFDSADLSEFWDDLRNRVGHLPEVSRKQTGGSDEKVRTLSKATLDAILRYYALDYDTYGDFLIKKSPSYTVA